MRPIKLEIEGLESFKEKQTIDFEKLSEYGIFGIFGETGSGKSSILDAIILSLYGKIPRVDGFSQEETNLKNFLNNFSKNLEVYFKFALGEDIYEIKRTYYLGITKRKEELKLKTIILIKNEKIIADKLKEFEKKLQEEFGLKMDDFIRTVVLPQGKFNEFLKLKGNDKRKMLEDIFNMKEYGEALKKKSLNEKKYWDNEVLKYENQLIGAGDTSLEEIELLEKDLKSNKKNLELLEKEKKEFEIYYKERESLRKLIILKEEISRKKEFLDKIIPEIENKKIALKKFENSIKIKDNIDALNQNTKSLNENEKKLKALEKKKEEFTNKIDTKNKSIKEIEETILKNTELIKNIDFSSKLYNNVNKILIEKKEIKRNLNFIKNYTEENIQNETILKAKTSELKNYKKLLDNELSKKIDTVDENKINLLTNEKSEIERIIKDYKNNEIIKSELKIKILELENKEKSLIEKEKTLSNEILNLENKRRENFTFELAKTLKEGTPCPVCGSIHHSKNLNFTNTYEKNNFDSQLEKLKKEELEIISSKSKISGKLEELKNSFSLSNVIFKDKIVDQSYFNILENIYLELDKKIIFEKQKNLNILNLEKEREKNISNYKNNIALLEKDIDFCNSKILNNNNLIKTSNKAKNIALNNIKKIDITFENFSIEELEKKLSFLENNQTLLEKYQKEQNDLISKKDKLKIEKENFSQNIILKNNEIISLTTKNQFFENEVSKFSNIVNSLMKEFGFNSIDEVNESYLSQENYNKLSAEVDKFFKDKEEISALLNNYQNQINGDYISKEDMDNLENKKEAYNKNITDLKVIVINTENIISQKKQLLEILTKIKKDKKIAEKKQTIAEDLYGKLKSGEFITFLATKKLKSIVKNASRRISKISNGQYELISDENCDFFIVDSFNDGLKRRVGTLSGGETFVVSLCLALALSKQLQLKRKKTLEFFFLDEGFGTLDSKLLDKVMDSIENIREEEKITIGIISHLEELKIRIIKRVEVEKAIPGEKGSRIKLI